MLSKTYLILRSALQERVSKDAQAAMQPSPIKCPGAARRAAELLAGR